MANELQEYIDSPNETLSAEYKSWLDLADSAEAKADLARHICALANHGGGVLVFGFTDDLKSAGPNPFPKVSYNRDLLAGIVRRYLDPSFQCDVQVLKSAGGKDHPVVVIPPLGSVPICARRSGPMVDGKIQGIVQGTHYVRKPGPESAPVTSAADWAPIIRRCAMSERSTILSAIDAALRGAKLTAEQADVLQKWHDAAHAAFEKDLKANKNADECLRHGHFQLSYAIDRTDNQKLDHGELLEILRQANLELADTVRTGWSMFHVFTRPEIAPRYVTDTNAGTGDEDFLECAMLRDTKPVFFAPDMWRVAPNGYATIIRPYWEDDQGFEKQTGKVRGTWFSPNFAARHLAEFIRHARAIAERLDGATAIRFRCEWRGLGDREWFHPMATWLPGAKASEDRRVTVAAYPVASLATNWHEAVSELAAPVLRMFRTDWHISPEWVRSQAQSWLKD